MKIIIAAIAHLVISAGLLTGIHAAPSEPIPDIDLVEASPVLGDVIHFTYVLPKGVKEECNYQGRCARIQVVCSRDGQIIYAEAMPADYNAFLLGGGGSIWLSEGGTADCVATLYEWKYPRGQQTFVPYAETSF
jgi:hypothetical protein